MCGPGESVQDVDSEELKVSYPLPMEGDCFVQLDFLKSTMIPFVLLIFKSRLLVWINKQE